MLGVVADGVLGVDTGAVLAKERRMDREEESAISVRYDDGRHGGGGVQGCGRLP